MKLSLAQISEIKTLRAKGHTIPEISNKLNIAKTSVHRYASKIAILPEFLEEWKIKRGANRQRMLEKEKLALSEASKLVGKLSVKEKILFLSALYWAEGNKKDFIFTNTDAEMIKVFVDGLRDVLGVENERISVSIRVYEDMDINKCLDYWSYITGIKKEKFLGVNVLNGKKKGKLEFGMCRVRVLKGGDILKKIKATNRSLVLALAKN